MTARTRTPAEALRGEMHAHIGRFTAKRPDWDAFPSNRGFAELERAQIRYIGAGGSPKVTDPDTMKPGHFTLSLIHQPAGKYAASHAHEIEEAFLVLEGVLTVGWDYDDEIIETRLGPRDLVLNAPWRPHGFRNDGVAPVLCSVMVGNSRPMPTGYKYHPRDVDPALARAFGATPGRPAVALGGDPSSPHQRDMARWVIRYNERHPEWTPAGFARFVYIGEGGAPPGLYREDLIHVPVGRGVRGYRRTTEDAYLVIGGCLTVSWEADGAIVEERLGPRDVVMTPAGRIHSFRNEGIEDAEFMMVVGTPQPEDVTFQAWSG